MGLFNKFKKNKNNLQQNLSIKDEHPGAVFVIHLLMEEKCEMPNKETMCSIMENHLGKTECFSYDNSNMAGFAPLNYMIHSENDGKEMPPQLMIMECSKIEKPVMDEIAVTQTWDCPESSEILERCGYRVIATDMMASFLEYKDRADMLVNFIEALMEMYPSCKAVIFENSKKMFTRAQILNCDVPKESRFIYYAVNVRFFNVEGTNDMLVDTLGMSTLFLPDLQYHFHDVDPNDIVNHAYNMLSYIYNEDNPIKSGDYIDGIADGVINPNIRWYVQYEKSLIQPERDVIDVNMGEFASGGR